MAVLNVKKLFDDNIKPRYIFDFDLTGELQFCSYAKELGPRTAKLALLLIKIVKHGIVLYLLHK